MTQIISYFTPQPQRFSFPLSQGDRVLVIAPHPDDECLGCGGSIIALHSAGIHVSVVLLTNGNRNGLSPSPMRLHEFLEAKAQLSYDDWNGLNFSDGRLKEEYPKLVSLLTEQLILKKPAAVFLPYPMDPSPDHMAACKALAAALTHSTSHRLLVLSYEIWTPILFPNLLINISDCFHKKKQAISCYKSQQERYDIIAKAEALGILRAQLTMRHRFQYAEAFKLTDAKQYIAFINQWRALSDIEEVNS